MRHYICSRLYLVSEPSVEPEMLANGVLWPNSRLTWIFSVDRMLFTSVSLLPALLVYRYPHYLTMCNSTLIETMPPLQLPLSLSYPLSFHRHCNSILPLITHTHTHTYTHTHTHTYIYIYIYIY